MITEGLAEDWAKIELIRSTLPAEDSSDPYLARQIKEAIEFSLEKGQARVPLRKFVIPLKRMAESYKDAEKNTGFALFDLEDRPLQPLWFQSEILKCLRSIAGYRKATLVILGLKEAICPPKRVWTAQREARFNKYIAYVDDLALKFGTPNSLLCVLYL